MKVFTVRIQLPEGRDDEMAGRLLALRFAEVIKAAAGASPGFRVDNRSFRLVPGGTAVQVNDEAGAVILRVGEFRRAPPDEGSAAEEKGDAKREGDRR